MKLKNIKNLILFFILILLFIYSPTVLAEIRYLPLVPCGLSPEAQQKIIERGWGDPENNYTHECTTCDFFRLAKNIIDFILFGIVPPVGAVLFVISGLIILLSGGNQKLLQKGKDIFWNVALGAAIIFGSWMIVNTLIKSFGPNQIKTSWWKFQCQAAAPGTIGTGGGPPSPPTGPEICRNPQTLAQQNNVPYPQKNAPELDALISCIESKIPRNELGSIFTYDVSHPLCNFTRGQRICGECSHSVNSCHYGGRSGTTGALSVDFGNEAIADRIKDAACGCGAKQVYIEGDHVHVDSRSCDDVNPRAISCR